MKKRTDKSKVEAQDADLQPEYDFSRAKRVGRKYLDRLEKGTNLVAIDPDLHKIFPDSESVNAALRALADAARAQVKLRRSRQ
jgi:hypothetical protein